MNINITEIKKTIEDVINVGLFNRGKKGLIVSIPQDIIDELSEFSYPTIHDVLEVLLYYVTYTDRIVECDNYLYRLLEEQAMTDVTLVKIITIIEGCDIVNRLSNLVVDNSELKRDEENLFTGWLLEPTNVNFYTTFDFVLLENIHRF